MGRCVEKIPCRKEGCNGNNSLQVFLEEDGNHTGWCFKCGTYYKDPYEDKPDDYKPPSPLKIKSPEDIAQELAEVSELGCTDLPDRSLTNKVLEFYGCKVAISEYDGVTPIATYFPYYDEQSNLKGYKVKTNEGHVFAKGTTKGVMPFGWDKVAKANKYKLFITEGECFLPETEVLTPEGWVTLADWDGQDVMTSYGKFETPVGKVWKDYEGDLVRYESGSYKSTTTPMHDMLRINPKSGDVVKVKACDYTKNHWPVPRVASDYKTRRSLHARIQVMLSADFTFREGGDLLAGFSKERKIERCKDLLDEAGVRYTLSSQSSKSEQCSFFIHRGHGLDASKLFSYERDLPYAREIIDEILYWDGNSVPNRNQIEYSSKELHNAKFIQTCAHLCGYTSTIIPRSNQHGSWYKVSILFGKQTSSTQKGATLVPYKGKVACLTMPSGTLMVRQEGSISVSGNCDAMALFRVLMKSWKAEGYPAVISLPHGATSAASQLEIVHQNRHRFKEIVLVFDQDEPGRKAVADVAKLLPGVKVATLPLKDANDMLIAGRERELFEAVMFEAREKVSSQSFRSSELWHLAEAEPIMGLPWPWESMTDLTRGRRRKEVYYFGAGKLMPAINALNCWEALTYSRG